MNDETLSTAELPGRRAAAGPMIPQQQQQQQHQYKAAAMVGRLSPAGRQLPPHFGRDYGEMISRRDACQNNMTYWLRKSTARGQDGAHRTTISAGRWSVAVASHLHSAQVGRQYIKIELDAAPASVDHVTHY